MNITISLNDILYNNFFLATISSLLATTILFIDRCIFIKKNNYVTYAKLFTLVFITTYLTLLFKDTNISNDINLEVDNSPFN